MLSHQILPMDTVQLYSLLVSSIAWTYVAVRALTLHDRPPPWDLFALYSVLLASSLVQATENAYKHYVEPSPVSLMSTSTSAVDLGSLCVSLFVVLRTRFALQVQEKECDEVCSIY